MQQPLPSPGERRSTNPPQSQEDAIEPRQPTVSQLRDLPVTISLMTAAQILGIGRTKAYELARHGEFPCLVIRVGDLYRVSTADLLRLLGTGPDEIHGRNDASPGAA